MNTFISEDTLSLKDLAIEGYERVVEVRDPACGLHAIIAIHNTKLGPALGGIRMHTYRNFEAALMDVLRLSEGMTFKSSTIQAGLGGGKSVIIGDPKTAKTPALLESFGRAINLLQGLYIGAEDSGISPEDLNHIRKKTQFLVGLDHEKSSGNPCAYTAYGTFWGIRAVAKKLFGSWDLRGKTVAIQGLGNVGILLAKILYWEGAHLIVSDIHPEKITAVVKETGAKAVDPTEILSAECDILVPCAMGAILNVDSIEKLKCKAIAGCANNQLEKTSDGDLLKAKGILYAPDFVINAGGLINVNAELSPQGYDPITPQVGLCQIYETLLDIFQLAEDKGICPRAASYALAEYNIEHGVGKRAIPATFHH